MGLQNVGCSLCQSSQGTPAKRTQGCQVLGVLQLMGSEELPSAV